MRIVSVFICFGIGAYSLLKLWSPLPVIAESCSGDTGCAGAIATASGEAGPPGFRIEVYDPAIEPRFPDEAEGAGPVRIVSAEVPWIVDGGSPGVLPPPPPVRSRSVTLTRLGQPGAHGVCLALNGGRRHCVGVIPAHDE